MGIIKNVLTSAADITGGKKSYEAGFKAGKEGKEKDYILASGPIWGEKYNQGYEEGMKQRKIDAIGSIGNK